MRKLFYTIAVLLFCHTVFGKCVIEDNAKLFSDEAKKSIVEKLKDDKFDVRIETHDKEPVSYEDSVPYVRKRIKETKHNGMFIVICPKTRWVGILCSDSEHEFLRTTTQTGIACYFKDGYWDEGLDMVAQFVKHRYLFEDK